MKFNQNQITASQSRLLSVLDPPYVATISHIDPDPHSGLDMYLFKECRDGWYESEIDDLCIEKIVLSDTNVFNIIDLE